MTDSVPTTTSSAVARAAVVGMMMLATILALAFGGWSTPTAHGPNIVVIVTDDQSFSSITQEPSVMPFLQGLWSDPSGHWVRFPEAFISTPLCCPSRSTILSGQYAFHTGVLRNGDGGRFRADSTIATWLHDRGYRTGLFGKYLNRYPFGLPPTVPPGWDEWLAKIHGDADTVYYDYSLSDNGVPVSYGHEPQDYMPDVLTEEATSFIRHAPVWKPFFLYYSPTAPHAPWVPATRDLGTWSTSSITSSPSVNEADVSDKPMWVQDQAPLSPGRLAQLDLDHRAEFETLGAVDDGVRAIYTQLQERGLLDNTIIVFLSDNGYSYGEHRLIAKTCAYDECAQVPFAIYVPGAQAHVEPTPVSNADLAATIASAVGFSPPLRQDGISLLPASLGGDIHRDGVLLEWAGDAAIPPYWGYRTADYLYVEYPLSGERELYDSVKDPRQLTNVADEPRYEVAQRHLAARLHALMPVSPPEGTMLSPAPSPGIDPAGTAPGTGITGVGD